MLSTGEFRRGALACPGSVEGSHFDVADFRVRGRIFATLREADGRAVLKLAPDQQLLLMTTRPGCFEPVPGSWGAKGWTRVMLERTDEPTLQHAIAIAWRSVAPKAVIAASEEGGGQR